MKKASIVLGIGLSCLLWMGLGSMTGTAQQFSAPVEARVPMAPTPARGSDGHMHLEYELHVTNFYASNGPLHLRELSVFAQGASSPLATYKANDLADIARPHLEKSSDAVLLPAGSRTVFFLWITLPDGAVMPKILLHHMSFEDAKGIKRELQGVSVTLPQRPVITLAPPLPGGRNWLVSEGPGNSHSHHWGSLLALNGVVTIPQRYAIDYVGLNARGHALEVAPDKVRDSVNTDWFGYDSDVLAVADGVVRDARDELPDGKPMSSNKDESDLTARGLYGNFVILEIAPGVFAHYAHLRPGSIRVHAGERVHSGEMIAHLGDSGNSAAPHLHFHLSDKPTFEESEGLPFRFAHFINEGTPAKTLCCHLQLRGYHIPYSFRKLCRSTALSSYFHRRHRPPRGIPHVYVVLGNAPARHLNIYDPAEEIEAFFRDCKKNHSAGAKPDQAKATEGEKTVSRAGSSGRRYDQQPLVSHDQSA